MPGWLFSPFEKGGRGDLIAACVRPIVSLETVAFH